MYFFNYYLVNTRSLEGIFIILKFIFCGSVKQLKSKVCISKAFSEAFYI